MYNQVSVAFGEPGGKVSYKQIPNPLLKYNFRDVEMHKKYFINGRPGDPNVIQHTPIPLPEAQAKTVTDSQAPDQVWSAWLSTMRCPDEDGVTQHDVVDTQMYQQNRKLVPHLLFNNLIQLGAGGDC